MPAPAHDEPSVVVEARETIELAYLAAIQHLPPRQRAVLILRDAMSWSAREIAELLDLSEAAANSLLQRARATMRTKLPERPSEWTRAREITDAERDLLRRYIAASEAADATAFSALLAEDVRQTMPPLPMWWDGKELVGALNRYFLEDGSEGDLRAVATAANRQPAAAFYLRKYGETEFRLIALDVLTIRGRPDHRDGHVRSASLPGLRPAGGPRLVAGLLHPASVKRRIVARFNDHTRGHHGRLDPASAEPRSHDRHDDDRAADRQAAPHRAGLPQHRRPADHLGLAEPAKRGWIHNLEADPHLTFHLKRSVHADLPATGRVITDPAERRQLAEWIVANAWPNQDVEAMVRFSPFIEVTIDELATDEMEASPALDRV